MGKKREKSQNLKFNKIRNYIILLVIILVLVKINKTVFYITVFSGIAYYLKFIRGRYGLKPVVLDTLHFSAIMIAKYLGLAEAILFVAINTLFIDFVTFIASDGTFANFFFYSISTIFAVLVFGNADLLVFGSIAAFIYSVLYFSYRTFIVWNPPFDVISKCITSFIFTFLYLSFLGPLVRLLLTAT